MALTITQLAQEAVDVALCLSCGYAVVTGAVYDYKMQINTVAVTGSYLSPTRTVVAYEADFIRAIGVERARSLVSLGRLGGGTEARRLRTLWARKAGFE